MARPATAALPAEPAATATQPLADVDQLSAGFDHMCALRQGQVYCWGESLLGGNAITFPTRVGGLTDIAAIDAGGRRTCALAGDGRLFCWGELLGERGGFRGQVVVGAPDSLSIHWGRLSHINFGFPVTKFAVGAVQTCAITDNRELYCWGSTAGGVLDRMTPRREARLMGRDASDVEVGQAWACFVTEGKRQCRGSSPGLGNLVQQQQHVPMPGWIVASCGVSDAGKVVCMGRHSIVYGGDEIPQQDVGEKVTIEELDNVDRLALGGSRACALRRDQSVWCWSESSPPRIWPLPGPAVSIEVAGSNACAIVGDERAVYCGMPGEAARAMHFEPGDTRQAISRVAVVSVTEAVERYRLQTSTGPTDLEGTTWSACVTPTTNVEPPCSFCRYTLRFEPERRFVAAASCKDARYNATYTGRWKRTGDSIVIREKPAARGTAWQWTLTVRGQALEGERAVRGQGLPASLVKAKLSP